MNHNALLALLAPHGLMLVPNPRGSFNVLDANGTRRLHQVNFTGPNGAVSAGYFNRRPAQYRAWEVTPGPGRHTTWTYQGQPYVLTAMGHVKLWDVLNAGTLANVLAVL